MTAHQENKADRTALPVAVSQKGEVNSSNWSWVPKAVALLSGASVTLLLLLGYGVAVAVESRLGVARSSLYEGATDLLELSSIVIMMNLSSLSHSTGDLLTQVYRESGGAMGAALLLWPVLIAGRWLGALGRSGGLVERWPRLVKLLSRANHLALGWPQLWFPMALIISPAITALAVGVCMAVVSFPVLAVAIGMGAGQTYLTRYVLEPMTCASTGLRSWPVSPDASEKQSKRKSDGAPGATCLVIEDLQGKEIVRGRLAVSTTKAIVIVPRDGAARVFDSKGLAQHAVGEL